MPTNYPGGIDNFNNPTPANNLNDGLVLHSDEHSNANDAINALERWVGISGSTNPATIEYRVNHVTGTQGPPGPAGAGNPGIGIWASGVFIATGTVLNFTGDAVFVSASGTVVQVTITGSIGPMGPQGAIGPSGSPGSQGPIGPSGSPGNDGAQGPVGPSGSPGSVGPQGPIGPSGSPGIQGIQGIQGPTGSVGPQGIQGIQGPTGTAGVLFIGSPANGLSLSGQTLSLGLASSGVAGALSGGDWSTFNGKQDALGFVPINKAGDIVSGSNVLTLVGGGYDPALKFAQNSYAQNIFNVYDDTNTLVFYVQPLRNYVHFNAVGGALILDTPPPYGYVEVSNILQVDGQFRLNSDSYLSLVDDATIGVPIKDSAAWGWRANAYDGVNYPNVVAQFWLTKDNYIDGHGTLNLAMSNYQGTRTPIVLKIDQSGKVTFMDGGNLSVGTVTGTRIGTAANQKLGFWNALPVVQPSGDIVTALGTIGLVASPTINFPQDNIGAWVQVTGVALGTGTIFNFTGPGSVISISGTTVQIQLTGTPGPQGTQGIQGVQGPTGAIGPQGPTGPSGSPGSIGPQGIQGVAGTPLLGTMGWNGGIPLGTGTVLNVNGSRLVMTLSGTTLNLSNSSDPAELIGVYGETEGQPLGTGTTINFRGPLLTTSISGTSLDVYATGTPSVLIVGTGAYLGQFTTLDFEGTNISVTSSGTFARIFVTGTALQGATSNTFFLTTGSASVSTYDLMTVGFPTGSFGSYSATIAATGTIIQSWITEVNVPFTAVISDGIYHTHIHATQTGGARTAKLLFQVFIRTAGGVETLIGTSEQTPALTGVEQEFDLEIFVGEQLLNLTDRIVLKIYGESSGSGGAPVVLLRDEGNTLSRLEIPAVAPVAPTTTPIQLQNAAVSQGNISSLNVQGSRLVASVSGTTGLLTNSPDPAELIGVYGVNQGTALGTGTTFSVTGSRLAMSLVGTTLNLTSSPEPIDNIGVMFQHLGTASVTGTIINVIGSIQNSGTTMELRVPKVYDFAGPGQGVVVYSSMPAADTQWQGTNTYADLAGYTQMRFSAFFGSVGAFMYTGTNLHLKYTSNLSAPAYAEIVSDPTARKLFWKSGSFQTTDWVNIVGAAAVNPVGLSVFSTGGNGTVSPNYGVILAEFR